MIGSLVLLPMWPYSGTVPNVNSGTVGLLGWINAGSAQTGYGSFNGQVFACAQRSDQLTALADAAHNALTGSNNLIGSVCKIVDISGAHYLTQAGYQEAVRMNHMLELLKRQRVLNI